MATVLCCAHIIQLHLILRGGEGGGGGGRETEVDTFGWIGRSENPSRVYIYTSCGLSDTLRYTILGR